MLREGQLDEDEGMIFGKRFLHGSWVLYKIIMTEISDGTTSLFHLPHQPKKRSQGSGRSNNLEPCGDEASLKYPTLGVKDLDTAFKILSQIYGGGGGGKEGGFYLIALAKYG